MMKAHVPRRTAIAAGLLLAPPALSRPPLDRPNIVVILLDDAGYGDFTHSGHPVIRTPNISRLATEGATFTQFYSGAPACTASRYALLTGRSPARSGLAGWAIGPEAKRYIHPREVTLAEGLKARGYATGIFGKWHLGTPNAANGFTPLALPLAQGFDEWYGTNVSHDYPDAALIEGPAPGDAPSKGYHTIATNLPSNTALCRTLTRTTTDRAIDFLDQHLAGKEQ